MKKNELKKKLLIERIPANSYWLDEDTPCVGEVYCLAKNKDNWEVYYSERGQKSSLKIFNNEDEACDYFYNWLVNSLKRMNLI